MNKVPVSFEFFPPKSEIGLKNLLKVAKDFLIYEPEYFSVTFGAGGTTQSGTLNTVLALQEECKIDVAPHISCIGISKNKMYEILNAYKNNNIKRLVVLRGDIPFNQSYADIPADFKYASDLVTYIREEFKSFFHIEVGAYPETHPQSKSLSSDFIFFKQKVANGANAAITQYFYNIDAYVNFVKLCRENLVNIPIVPGIMPIYNVVQLERFSDMCGADLPRWIRKRIEELQEFPTQLEEFSVDIIVDLCEKLLKNKAPALHFYTLNKSELLLKVLAKLKCLK